jgi:hypothetical protein
MDYIALLSFLLAIVALAGFALEFIFTGTRDRLYKAVEKIILQQRSR